MIRHLALVSSIALAAVGCDTSAVDMGKQPKANTYEQTEFFADGSTARPLPPGVVSVDAAVNPTTNPVVPLEQSIPMPITRDLIERGQTAYAVACSVCHGRLGNGDGMIVQRGFSRPPSFHAQRLKDAPDAHFYNVITNGFGAMFSYSDRVPPEDRWAVVAYIRALQAGGDQAQLAPAERAALAADIDPNRPRGGAR